MRTCLSCASEMRVVEREGVELDVCPQGHGIWLDGTELADAAGRVVDARPAQEKQAALDATDLPPAADGSPARVCPDCGEQMEHVEYDGPSRIYIDTCPNGHGVWLDDGELERAEAWIEASRDELAVVRENMERQVAMDNAEVDEVLQEPNFFRRVVKAWKWARTP